jgi:hypothetical protein
VTDDDAVLPWQAAALSGWSIVGMNHYRKDGERWLFVAMVKHGRCIQAEGPDTIGLWRTLIMEAKK